MMDFVCCSRKDICIIQQKKLFVKLEGMMDSYDAFVVHEARQAKALAMRPKCGVCKEPIQSDEAIYYDGDYYCEDCKGEFIELMVDLYTERIN